MEIFQLKATVRSEIGGPKARRMRKAGQVPAVIYGHGENVHCTLEEADLRHLLITPKVYLVDLSVDGKVEKVILKDVQYHPVTDRPIHLDFYRYVEDEELTMAIPVVLRGHARGVKAGGKLVQGLRRLRVRGYAKNLPDFLPVEVTRLRIGDVLLVADVSFENLTVVDTKTVVVAAIKTQRGAAKNAAADDDEEGEEPTEEASAE